MGRGHCSSHFLDTGHHIGKLRWEGTSTQEQELKQGPREEDCLLACFLWLSQLPFLHGLGPPTVSGPRCPP